MSIGTPNCKLSYPKDLSRLYLDINVIEFPDLTTSCPYDIKVTIKINGVTTLINGTSFLAEIIPSINFTGTISKVSLSSVITGDGTSFSTEMLPGDVVQLQSSDEKYFIINSITSDTELISQSTMFTSEVDVIGGVIRPKLELLPSQLIAGASILSDGYYEVTFDYYVDNVNFFSNTIPFSIYILANQYNCVESKLMNLALHCSEGCVDMEILKNTLLVKALLDAMEISINESDIATTQLIKDKIDRYCLLLNNNCTSC